MPRPRPTETLSPILPPVKPKILPASMPEIDLDALGLQVCPPRSEEPDDRSIGGTALAAIVGASKWATPFDVWAKLTGKAPKEEANRQMTWGSRHEPTILEAYREEVNPSSVRCAVSFRLRAKPHFRLSPDALAEPSVVVDAKTSRWRNPAEWGADNSDEVPVPYLFQLTWYCRFLRREAWDIAALFGGSDFVIFRGRYDRDLGDWLEDEADRFWTKYVLRDTPPDQVEGSMVDAWLRSRFPSAVRKVLDPAPLQVVDFARQHVLLNLAGQWVKKETEKVDNALKLAIGSGAGFAGDGFKVRWSDVNAKRTDWKLAFEKLLDFTITHTKAEDIRRITDAATKPTSYRRFTVNATEEFTVRSIDKDPTLPVPLLPPASSDEAGE